ncbi:MAG: hypothetical protein QM723_32430 [Myxococcaceae bacterium]
MAKVPPSLLPGSQPSAKPVASKPTSAAKNVAANKQTGKQLTQAKIIKGNMASLKALRAFKPSGSGAGKAGESEEVMHADVMSGAHDQAELEKALSEGWVPTDVEEKEDKEEAEELAKAAEGEKAEKGEKEGSTARGGAFGKQAPARSGVASGQLAQAGKQGTHTSNPNLPRAGTGSSNPNLPKAASSDFKQLARNPSGSTGTHAKLSANELSKAEQLSSVKAVAAAAAKAASEKPLDAFAVLNQAKDKGVFYREDEHGGSHPEDRDDPALAAAVEETIRVLFGVRGVLRVGPGRNEANEPVVVVVAGNGFTDQSLVKVPLKVHNFDTLLALSYELLPLRRER